MELWARKGFEEPKRKQAEGVQKEIRWAYAGVQSNMFIMFLGLPNVLVGKKGLGVLVSSNGAQASCIVFFVYAPLCSHSASLSSPSSQRPPVFHISLFPPAKQTAMDSRYDRIPIVLGFVTNLHVLIFIPISDSNFVFLHNY